MNIVNFKHLALTPENKNKAKKFDIKGKSAFTFVEIMIAVVLIGILCLAAAKIIKHNMQGKIPLYVYYLYKNLENESYALNKKLKKQEGNQDKKIEDIINNMTAENYCQAFADDMNTVGNVDCNMSSKDIGGGSGSTINIDYDCYRKYTYSVDDNGQTTEKDEPCDNIRNQISNYDKDKLYPFCKDNTDFSSSSILCQETPENNIFYYTDNKVSHVYSCNKPNNMPDVPSSTGNLDVDDINIFTSYELNNALKLMNNIRFKFYAQRSQEQEEDSNISYNLKAYYEACEICPDIHDSLTLYSLTIQDNNAQEELFNNSNHKNLLNINKQYTKINSNNENTNISFMGIFEGKQYNINLQRFVNSSNVCYKYDSNNNFVSIDDTLCGAYKKGTYPIIAYQLISSADTNNSINRFYVDYLNTLLTNKDNSCYEYKNAVSTFLKSFPSEVKDDDEIYYEQKNNYWTEHFNLRFRPKYKLKDGVESLTTYKTKWNDFKKSYSAINGWQEEGTISSNIDLGNSPLLPAHLIYAAIDTDFKKGKMNKNIFAFEHFGNKIIPVGYLANNPNTPLKFDVITRDTTTWEIKKVNYGNGRENRPLTFCEAMRYTGDEFSSYCGCKDDNGYDIRQYTLPPNHPCDNSFGCKIRPVKPAVNMRF